MIEVSNLNIERMEELVTPEELKREFPLTDEVAENCFRQRQEITRIMTGEDKRLLVVLGPCSIHDIEQGREYAERLAKLGRELEGKIKVVMRAYFEKPRTILGWKGLIPDPRMDDSFDMNEGLWRARKLCLEINELELGVATELLDPITPAYLSDLLAWAAIGARTTESQTHRQMASGLSMPVGFKNSTDGDCEIAVNAMQSARGKHAFMGITDEGKVCIVRTQGNEWGHLVLRGGKNGPNYEEVAVKEALGKLKEVGLREQLMIDCSHANSGKEASRQEEVLREVVRQRSNGLRGKVFGVMLESNLRPGKQEIVPGRALEWGVSCTDECIGWEETEGLLRWAAK